MAATFLAGAFFAAGFVALDFTGFLAITFLGLFASEMISFSGAIHILLVAIAFVNSGNKNFFARAFGISNDFTFYSGQFAYWRRSNLSGFAASEDQPTKFFILFNPTTDSSSKNTFHPNDTAKIVADSYCYSVGKGQSGFVR